jgi:hypothetical protein
MARGLYVADTLPPLDLASRAAVNTFTTFQDVYGSPQKILPKSRMDAGLEIELFAGGTYGTTGTPTLSCGFWFNGAALAAPTTILGQSQLAAPGGTTVTAGAWNAYLRARLRSIGTGAAGGTWRIIAGFFKVATSTTPFNTLAEWNVPTTDALRTVTCDVTADRAVGVGWQWGTSSASNTVTVDDFDLRVLS